jgi:hypothetical protein
MMRGDAKDVPMTGMKALNLASVSQVGKLMHKIVKAAVHLQRGPASPTLREALDAAVSELIDSEAGPTIQGWLKE